MADSAGTTPVIGFSARAGTGRTTLLKKVIPHLRARDLRIAVIKHAHDDFDVDHPGKDSYELRKADVYQTLVASSRRKALITEFEAFQAEPTLSDLIADLDHEHIDLILVEGYSAEHYAKIELHRSGLDKPFLFQQDEDIIALAADQPVDVRDSLMQLDMNNAEAVADFIYHLLYA